MAVPGRMEADVLSALRCALLCSAVGLFEVMSVGSAVDGIRGQEVINSDRDKSWQRCRSSIRPSVRVRNTKNLFNSISQ
jgi:hypothetical protein